MKPLKLPTPAQKSLLYKAQHIKRVCYVSQSPGMTYLKWYWVDVRDEHRYSDLTVSKCEAQGWIEVVKGELKPGTPEGLDGLRIAMGNWRLPDELNLTDAGREIIGLPARSADAQG